MPRQGWVEGGEGFWVLDDITRFGGLDERS